MLKQIIFDFDGTLVSSQMIILNAYNQVASKYQANRIDVKDIEYLKALSIQERCKFVNFKLYKFPMLAIDVYRGYKQQIKDLHFFEGMRNLLTGLKEKGYGISIISTNSKEVIEQFLASNDIHFVDQILCSNRLHGKDKDIKRFLKEKRLQSDEVVYVGDEIRDIIASKKNAVRVIWVTWGYDVIENVKNYQPDFIASTPEEIYDIVQAMN